VAKKYSQVPELVLGFDTETTGLSVQSARAISYGFCAYRLGYPVWSEHFYVIPDCPISVGAQRIHGLSLADLEEKRGGPEAVFSLEAGLARAIKILRDFHDRGAYVVGSNLGRFDLEMLRRSSISVLGNGLDNAYLDLSLLRIIDVVEHDLAIEPSRAERPRRGLGHLCAHYGVAPGGHHALSDARAAVEVFFEQVVRNNDGQVPMLLPMPRDDFMVELNAS
jgi:DNA polymerase III epsilon subunit-like protein